MDLEELKAVQSKFRQGLEKLAFLGDCLRKLGKRHALDLSLESMDEREGELPFWFAGTRYFVKVRITDRSIDDVGTAHSVPLGWLDWGRRDRAGRRDQAEHSNFYDERGILCELDNESFYCNLKSCDEGRMERGVLHVLQRLVGRALVLNTAQSS